MRFSNKKKFEKDQIEKENAESGAYIYLNKHGTPIYIGVASESISERLWAAYYGRSDYAQVKTKRQLRKQIRYYKTCYTTEARARSLEHSKKEDMRFNQL